MPVPIIIVSQRKETKDVIGGLRRGAVDYIRKPFEAEEVLARLGTILRFHMMDLQQRRASAKQVLLTRLAWHYVHDLCMDSMLFWQWNTCSMGWLCG